MVVVLAYLPVDHFLHRNEEEQHRHPVVKFLLDISRNLLGGILILLGVAMLVLPGQGLLTIAIGISLLKFPGRKKLIDWILSKPAVRQSLNWLRRRLNCPPFNWSE